MHSEMNNNHTRNMPDFTVLHNSNDTQVSEPNRFNRLRKALTQLNYEQPPNRLGSSSSSINNNNNKNGNEIIINDKPGDSSCFDTNHVSPHLIRDTENNNNTNMTSDTFPFVLCTPDEVDNNKKDKMIVLSSTTRSGLLPEPKWRRSPRGLTAPCEHAEEADNQSPISENIDHDDWFFETSPRRTSETLQTSVVPSISSSSSFPSMRCSSSPRRNSWSNHQCSSSRLSASDENEMELAKDVALESPQELIHKSEVVTPSTIMSSLSSNSGCDSIKNNDLPSFFLKPRKRRSSSQDHSNTVLANTTLGILNNTEQSAFHHVPATSAFVRTKRGADTESSYHHQRKKQDVGIMTPTSTKNHQLILPKTPMAPMTSTVIDSPLPTNLCMPNFQSVIVQSHQDSSNSIAPLPMLPFRPDRPLRFMD